MKAVGVHAAYSSTPEMEATRRCIPEYSLHYNSFGITNPAAWQRLFDILFPSPSDCIIGLIFLQFGTQFT
jgi:hypothetical protein